MKTSLFLLLLLWSIPQTYKPIYEQQFRVLWNSDKAYSIVASQIRMESNWDPKAELKTYREYGFGFGQITIAKTKTGKIRFNKFTEAKKRFKKLHNWEWKQRFNAKKQITFVILEDKLLYKKYGSFEAMLSVYNGGGKYYILEKYKCKTLSWCNHKKWWGNVEKVCVRSTKKWKGYGKSVCDINRQYVFRILKNYCSTFKE